MEIYLRDNFIFNVNSSFQLDSTSFNLSIKAPLIFSARFKKFKIPGELEVYEKLVQIICQKHNICLPKLTNLGRKQNFEEYHFEEEKPDNMGFDEVTAVNIFN